MCQTMHKYGWHKLKKSMNNEILNVCINMADTSSSIGRTEHKRLVVTSNCAICGIN